MRAIASAAISIYALLGTAFAQTLPTGGSCEQQLGEKASFQTVPSVTWIGNDALVRDHGKTFKGKIAGMRRHDKAFKFSVKYVDDIMGLSEVSVFRLPQSSPAKDRLGVVYFEQVDGGDRVVTAMTGFVDAKCILNY